MSGKLFGIGNSALKKMAEETFTEKTNEENSSIFDTLLGLMNPWFDDLSEANKEIIRLKQENTRLRTAYAILTHKRPRGRPRSKKLALKNDTRPAAGRPRNNTMEDMRETIKIVEKYKDQIKRETGKRPNDKVMIKTALDKNHGKTEGWKQRQEREYTVEQIRKKLKYYRDQTGLSQRAFKIAENSK